ncbi:MAG: hypothetical protein SX243_13820 [Acidobacteriota bacterium]|nr:hypothetical protein [Acidobacteriota bacterium]
MKTTRKCCRIGALAGALALLLTLLPAPSASASDSRWQREIQEIDSKLDAERWESAHKQATKLLKEVARRLNGGNDAGKILGVVLTQRAVASIVLEREDEALWDFHLAQNLFPQVLETDFTKYHPRTQILAERALSEEELASGEYPAELWGERRCSEDDPTYLAPESKRKGLQRPYPVGADKAGHDGRVTIFFLLTADGRLTRPLVQTKDRFPTIIWGAAELARKHSYTPAYCGETPVVSGFGYHVDYGLQ